MTRRVPWVFAVSCSAACGWTAPVDGTSDLSSAAGAADPDLAPPPGQRFAIDGDALLMGAQAAGQRRDDDPEPPADALIGADLRGARRRAWGSACTTVLLCYLSSTVDA